MTSSRLTKPGPAAQGAAHSHPLETPPKAQSARSTRSSTTGPGEAKVLFDVERQGDFMVVMEAKAIM